MYIRIYFGDKPLFLCDNISEDLLPYVHHDDAVYIDEFSTPAIKSMIHEMQLEKVHAGVFYYSNLEKLKKAFWKKFVIIQAAGGVVFNKASEILFIFRRGKWDLPKGKLDPGESLEECAIREVQEETGLKRIHLKKFLVTTFHTYLENGKHILKESYWYAMQADGHQNLVPQTDEDIFDIKWVGKNELHKMLANTFPSIAEVIALVNSEGSK